VYHTVQRGDTLWNIASRYEGATVQKLKKINKITSSKGLIPGRKIKVIIEG
jgi:membrane-bound lytic murein transglycosylase D